MGSVLLLPITRLMFNEYNAKLVIISIYAKKREIL